MEENKVINEEIAEETYQEEKHLCRYCGREMNTDFEFCIYCGKSQKETVLPAVKTPQEKKKTAPVVKAKKKNALSVALLVLSIVFFSLSLVFFLMGVLSWAGAGALTTESVFGNMFGSVDVSSYILCMINVVASFFSSLIFMFAGLIMLILKKR